MLTLQKSDLKAETKDIHHAMHAHWFKGKACGGWTSLVLTPNRAHLSHPIWSQWWLYSTAVTVGGHQNETDPTVGFHHSSSGEHRY